MLMAILAMYLFGGAGIGSGAILTSADLLQLEQRIEIVVEDNARREPARRVLRELQKDAKAFEKKFVRSGRELNKLYKVHEDNRDAALLILDDLNAEWYAGQKQALDARFALRDILTEKEWSAMFASDR